MKSNTARKLSHRFRSKRDAILRGAIDQVAGKTEGFRILDLGGRSDYWKRVGYEFLAEKGAQIIILNLVESEFGVDKEAPEGLFEFAVGDATGTDYPDNSFDFVHSNSVIEHVGMWGDMHNFAKETRRLAPAYYIQTPNFWFPVDPHFYSIPMNHWLPHPMRAFLMRTFNLATAGKAKDLGQAYEFCDSNALLTKAQMRYLFPDAQMKYERMALLTKSIIALKT